MELTRYILEELRQPFPVEDIREIPLTQGKVALVDAADYEWLSRWNWHCNSCGYACRSERRDGKSQKVWMHREIAGTPLGLDTDHINGNKLDNRRANLRHATRQQNGWNAGSTNTYGYKGVNFLNRPGRSLCYQARITVDGRRVFLGLYATPEEAAAAYDAAALYHYGEFAKLNFKESAAWS